MVNALTRYRQAENDAIRSGQKQDQVLWLINIGTVYYDLHEYEPAESASKEALQLARSLKDTGSTISCLQNLALIAIHRGLLEAAAIELDEAIRLESSAPDARREIYSRLIAAHLAEKKGNFSIAESAYLQILGNKASPTSVLWEAQAGLAQLHASQGKNKLAEQEFNRSISTISNAQESIEHEDFRLSFLSSSIRFYDEYVNFLPFPKSPT